MLTTVGTSRERIRVAKALAHLPKISDAFKDGRLSYSKVRSMTRVANEKNEEYLLNIGLNGTAVHVNKLVRQYRRAKLAKDIAQAHVQYESRSLLTYTDDNGMVVVRAVLPPEEGERFVKSLEAFRPDLALEDSVRERPQHLAQKNADALLAMAEVAIKSDAVASGADCYQVVVHVDSERAEYEDGSEATDVALSRILCDSSRVVLQEDESGNVLHVGRKTRQISPALRRALR